MWWISASRQDFSCGRPAERPTWRVHRTLTADTARPPERARAAQQRSDQWRAEFNGEPPHDALGGGVPADHDAPSPRPMRDILPAPEYPGHVEVWHVSRDGAIRLKKHQLFGSQALGTEHVGLAAVEDGVWSLCFYDRLLARLDERTGKLTA